MQVTPSLRVSERKRERERKREKERERERERESLEREVLLTKGGFLLTNNE